MDNRGSLERLVSSPVMHLDGKDPLNDQCNARKSLIEAIKAEKQLWTFIHSMGPSDTCVRELYRKACSSYENVILKDHEFAERHDIELALWRIHYKHIEEFRNRIQVNVADKGHSSLDGAVVPKDHNDSILDLFTNFLSEATEFYQDLVVKIRKSHGLPKEFSNLSEGDFSCRMESENKRRCQFLCHRCLIYLGDLARYRELYGRTDCQTRNWLIATRYYLDASFLWPESGNPQNQLAVLATYIGDELLTMYHCLRSLAVKEPFINAWDNLIFLFEKNRPFHLHAFAAKNFTFNFLRPSEWTTHVKELLSCTDSKYEVQEATDESDAKANPWCHFIQMISFFYTESRLEEFPGIFASALSKFEALLSLDDAKLEAGLESNHQHMRIGASGRKTPFRAIQLVSVLIFTVHALTESSELPMRPKYMEVMQQQPIFIQMAWTAAFIFMGRLVERYMMMTTYNLHSSPLLPSIMVFVEWLACRPDLAALEKVDEKCSGAMAYFFGVFVDLLNKFGYEFIDASVIESQYRIALWEDRELHAFAPLVPTHEPLNFLVKDIRKKGSEEREELEARKHRIFAAATKTVNRLDGTGKWTLFDKIKRKNRGNSAHEEEEEIIVYQRNTKTRSAPTSPDVFYLSSHASAPTCHSSGALSFDSSINEGFQFNVPHSDDSLRYPFFESSAPFYPAEQVTDQWSFVEVADSDRVGYPSLSTWSLESEKSSAAGEAVIIDPVKYGSVSSIDEDLFTLSIHDISASKQDSSPLCTAPVPSAPLLSDTEIFHEDYFQLGHVPMKSSMPMDFKDEKGNLARSVGTTLNDPSYSNWIRNRGFNPGFSECTGYSELPPRADTLPPWGVHRYGDIASSVKRFRDPNVCRVPTYDVWTNPSVSHPINFSEGPFSPVGFSTSYDAIGGYQRAHPLYGYGVSSDQRSGQMQLLQYLKEKECYMQRQHQLRGPV